MKEQNIRELLIHFIDSIRDYESESHNNIGFDDRESDELVDIYLKHNPEILDHLTAEQGDDIDWSEFGDTFIDFKTDSPKKQWETISTIVKERGYKIVKSQPPELTIREVVEWIREKPVDEREIRIEYFEGVMLNGHPKTENELTKIIRHERTDNL